MIKKPTRKQLNKIDLGIFYDLVKDSTHKDYFLDEVGKEHYKLLAYIAIQLPKDSIYIDLGTFKGLSALAASFNEKINIYTYDIADGDIEPQMIDRPNITFKHMSCFDDIEFIVESDFIFLDIDPHDGNQERRFIDTISEAGYKGQILCDDIHFQSQMKNFWNNLNFKKEDWTSIGHYSGSGMIYV